MSQAPERQQAAAGPPGVVMDEHSPDSLAGGSECPAFPPAAPLALVGSDGECPDWLSSFTTESSASECGSIGTESDGSESPGVSTSDEFLSDGLELGGLTDSYFAPSGQRTGPAVPPSRAEGCHWEAAFGPADAEDSSFEGAEVADSEILWGHVDQALADGPDSSDEDTSSTGAANPPAAGGGFGGRRGRGRHWTHYHGNGTTATAPNLQPASARSKPALVKTSTSLTWQTALQLLDQHASAVAAASAGPEQPQPAGRGAQTQPWRPRPPMLLEVPETECVFVEWGKTLRRSQGHDLWQLAGAKRRPPNNPQVICRYGKVTCATTGVCIAKAASYERIQPAGASGGSGGAGKAQVRARLFSAQRLRQRDGDSAGVVERPGQPRTATNEAGGLGQEENPEARSNRDHRRPLTMAEAETILLRLRSGAGALANLDAAAAAAVETCPPQRPAVLQLVPGHLFYENPPQRRCNATLGKDNATKDEWRPTGGQKGAHVYPKPEEGPPRCGS
eukprot:SAG22_NODE_613_length_8567_cov_4.215163_10_plen_506_part_00